MDKEQWQALNKAILEAALEGGRLAVSFFIGFMLDWLVDYFTKIPMPNSTILIIAGVIRLADKFWHTRNKELKAGIRGESMGLLPF